jgi:23S rRNA (pseudouridine1915-N3)-methyltransferase
MLKVKVIAPGKCKEPWLKTALKEYEKRLTATLELRWMEPKDNQHLQTILAQEDSYIALDPKGELFDSIALSQKLMHRFEEGGSKLTFALGGPEGFPSDSLQKASWKWSLSPLTFTHQIARLILVEQLYRALEIAKGSRYHK